MKTAFLSILITLFLLTGCVNKTPQHTPEILKNLKKYSIINGKKTQTIQTDRYTLVELEDPTKNYVLDQVIDTSLPKNLSLTIKDGMDYVLNQSGFTLCENSEVNVLYSKKLPKIHYKIGPVKLSDALQIMAGRAWQVAVDDVERTVCFELNEGYHINNTAPNLADLIPTLEPVANNNQKISTYQLPPKTIETKVSNTKKLVEFQQMKNEGKDHE